MQTELEFPTGFIMGSGPLPRQSSYNSNSGASFPYRAHLSLEGDGSDQNTQPIPAARPLRNVS